MGHVHQVTPKPKGVVKDTNSTKLMSQETDYIPNPPNVEESQIFFKADTAPIFEMKDLQERLLVVLLKWWLETGVATQKPRVPCALETNKLKLPNSLLVQKVIHHWSATNCL